MDEDHVGHALRAHHDERTDSGQAASGPAPGRRGSTTRAPRLKKRLSGDVGEGVVSAAIAVLVMAFLGALMWVGFRAMWETTEANTRTQVEQIGK